MNKTIIVRVLIIFSFLVVPAHAKDNQQAQKILTADDIVAKMTKQLGLTDQQAIDVKPIIENYLTQAKLLKLEEKDQLSKVLTGQQLFTWNFLENEPPREKKKKSPF